MISHKFLICYLTVSDQDIYDKNYYLDNGKTLLNNIRPAP